MLHSTSVAFTSSVTEPLLKYDDEYRMTFVLSLPGQVSRDNFTWVSEGGFRMENAKAMVILSSSPSTQNNVVTLPSTRALGPSEVAVLQIIPTDVVILF